jgi:CubicO group peptidase (beta-lactamase class C family)
MAMKAVKTSLLVSTLLTLLPVWAQDGPTPSTNLHLAAILGDVAAVQQHIAAGTDLDQKDAFGSTPLIIAATFGKIDVARALIEAGAELDITNNDRSTALHSAAFLGYTEIVEALLEGGANKYLRNNGGNTAWVSLALPFEDVKPTYDALEEGLAPLGLVLDYEQIEAVRPVIAEMLRPTTEELEAVDYAPLAGGDWPVSTPEEVGLAPDLLAELYLNAAGLRTLYSLLVIKDGYLIAEDYFSEGSIDQQTNLQSVTKSFISAFVGIALEQGCLQSVEQTMLEFFPEVADQITDPRKAEITIRELLQMRGGFPWEETDSALWDSLWGGNHVSNIVEFPLTHDPGTEFQYSNLTSHWLGLIVARECGMDLRSFAEEHLLGPLGAELGEDWIQDVDGSYMGSGGLHLTARDAAKFGLLYLDGGIHRGDRILPAEWVRESLQSYSEHVDMHRTGPFYRDAGYGYQWWLGRSGEHEYFSARGHGGQLIVLLENLGMVIVTTADPFFGYEHHFDSWPDERAVTNVVSEFIRSLPSNR